MYYFPPFFTISLHFSLFPSICFHHIQVIYFPNDFCAQEKIPVIFFLFSFFLASFPGLV